MRRWRRILDGGGTACVSRFAQELKTSMRFQLQRLEVARGKVGRVWAVQIRFRWWRGVLTSLSWKDHRLIDQRRLLASARRSGPKTAGTARDRSCQGGISPLACHCVHRAVPQHALECSGARRAGRQECSKMTMRGRCSEPAVAPSACPPPRRASNAIRLADRYRAPARQSAGAGPRPCDPNSRGISPRNSVPAVPPSPGAAHDQRYRADGRRSGSSRNHVLDRPNTGTWSFELRTPAAGIDQRDLLRGGETGFFQKNRGGPGQRPPAAPWSTGRRRSPGGIRHKDIERTPLDLPPSSAPAHPSPSGRANPRVSSSTRNRSTCRTAPGCSGIIFSTRTSGLRSTRSFAQARFRKCRRQAIRRCAFARTATKPRV